MDVGAQARAEAQDRAQARIGKEYRQNIVELHAKNYAVYFIEYYDTLQNKSCVVIRELNEYTRKHTDHWIELREVISEVESYVKNGFMLLNKNYKKHISHDYASE